MHPRLTRRRLSGKVIDIHSHAGVSLETYGRMEYPYASTVEGLAYRQRSGGIDVNVVFPFTSHLHFDLQAVMRGDLVPTSRPVSPTPYATENRLLLREVFDYCPELSRRFLPFVSIDTERKVRGQIRELERLAAEYPVYGIKVNPVLSQSRVGALLKSGAAFLDFAQERDLPFLIHVNPFPTDAYSLAADAFRVIEARPCLRFCLAHCLLFQREYLDRAAAAPNVWVDTAALKIQVDVIRAWRGKLFPATGFIDTDFTDHCRVMRTLAAAYPDTMIWGSDSPAYAYICRRKNTRRQLTEFRFKGTYEEEVAALRCLPPAVQRAVAGRNALDFLFGR